MNLEKSFKKTILCYFFLLFPYLISTFYYESSEVQEFNNINVPEWWNNESTLYAASILILIVTLLNLFSLYMLYNFKKNGKKIYIITLVILILMGFFSGPLAADPFTYVIEGLSATLSGALIVFLYFTPLNKKFNRF